MHLNKIRCGQIWGGIQGIDVAVDAAGIRAHLWSTAADGEEGGDIYYFSVCQQDLLTRIALCDVAGHGSRVRGISSRLYSSLEEYMNTLNGEAVLKALNHEACATLEGSFATGTVISYYREANELTFASAGHPPVMALLEPGGTWRELLLPDTDGPANLPLGILPSTRFDQGTLKAPSGSLLLVYSDGVLDTRSTSGQSFGAEGLRRSLSGMRNFDAVTAYSRLREDLEGFSSGRLNHDDLTFMAVELS